MGLTRRHLLAAAAAVPGLLVVGAATRLVGGATAGAISAARPATAGTTATRCAQCGSSEHLMLDPRCPRAPRVLS